jgi:hypothetical protein
MKSPFYLFLNVVLMSALTLLAFTMGAQPQPATNSATAWDTFVNRFIEAYFVTHPSFAVEAGRHEFDGQLPDWSAAALGREAKRLRSERQQALAFDPALLDERQRFERDYLISVIDRELFWLESAQWPYKSPMFYLRVLDPNVYVTREYAPLAQRLRAYIAYAKAVPIAVRQIRENLRTPLPRTYIEVGKTVFGGLATYYERDVPAVFASVEDPQLQEAFRAANAQAIKAMRGLAEGLEAQRAQATEAYALGPELFLKMLWETERVEVPLDVLEKAGRQDLDRNLAALRQACQAYAPGMTVPACVAKVQAVKPEGGAVEEARRQLRALKAFLITQDLVTIPGTEEAHMAESPPFMRWNLAYIDIPGPYERGLPSIYYVTPPDPSWSKAEREAYIPAKAALLFITVHEVWPGHFLQFLHSNRLPSKVGQLFVGYAFAEGWAHYAEEMMWEVGLNHGDPETHIGQLLTALLRNVRLLSAIGLHTQGMTVEESERMFRELAYQDSGNARQQAARGTFDPAYLNYTLGKLMIRKLRDEWTASRGGRQAWREFHDRFLSYGGPPIPLIRAAMLGPKAGAELVSISPAGFPDSLMSRSVCRNSTISWCEKVISPS